MTHVLVDLDNIALTHVLVDLDNIAFRHDVYDVSCTLKRIAAVLSAVPGPKTLRLFCNAATHRFLHDHADLRRLAQAYAEPTSNEKDAADFLLLDRFRQLLQATPSKPSKGHQKIVIVTADKTLARLVRYFSTTTEMYGVFKPHECSNMTVHGSSRFALAFNDRDDIDKFMSTLRAYRARSTLATKKPSRSSLGSSVPSARRPGRL